MLDIAIKYKDKLQSKMRDIWFQDKYKFYNYTTYYSDYGVETETWQKHQFVSVDEAGNILGFIGYNVNRCTNNCNDLGIVNFGDNKITFGRDLRKALNDIFEYFRFNKLSFCVVIGNPIEDTYDKMVTKYGGRIVGIDRQETKLIDGKYYDVKNYEILREDYIRAKKLLRKE